MDDINASLHLEGLELPNGWVVGPKRPSSGANGSFSVSYEVANHDGRKGFLKVLDLVSVFGDLEALGIAVNDYLAERDLLLLCGSHGMSRVIVALDHGHIKLDGYLPLLSDVHYIIFERADADLNEALSEARIADVAIRLELVHGLAVGLRQLHTRQVAHQDLKPSNALVFGASERLDLTSKVGDLGRAFQFATTTPHDGVLMPGDRSYAPPEQLYKFEYPDLAVRRYSADLYQLGSLICYAFAGVTMNALLAEKLDPVHHWDNFGDGYREALPYLQNAYSDVLADLRVTLPSEVASEISSLIECLCEPEAERRGHPRAKSGQGSPFALERIVAELNLAAVRARTRAKAAN